MKIIIKFKKWVRSKEYLQETLENHTSNHVRLQSLYKTGNFKRLQEVSKVKTPNGVRNVENNQEAKVKKTLI